MSIWKKTAACTATALACLVLVTAPASAAGEPTMPFGPAYKGPEYGATWARGTITWFARSVRINGEVRTLSSSGCRRVYLQTHVVGSGALDTVSTSPRCGDGVHKFTLTAQADRIGGACCVMVGLEDQTGYVHWSGPSMYFRSDAD